MIPVRTPMIRICFGKAISPSSIKIGSRIPFHSSLYHPTTIAITPKPVPPVVTTPLPWLEGLLLTSRAIPLTGPQIPKKYRRVCFVPRSTKGGIADVFINLQVKRHGGYRLLFIIFGQETTQGRASRRYRLIKILLMSIIKNFVAPY